MSLTDEVPCAEVKAMGGALFPSDAKAIPEDLDDLINGERSRVIEQTAGQARTQ